MARKVIYKKLIRFYEGEEELVQALEALDNSVIVSEFLKGLIRDAVVKGKDKSVPVSQASPVDVETLAKELLPQIRKVIEAVLVDHTIQTSTKESQTDEETQQRIQEGLKKLGQSMM